MQYTEHSEEGSHCYLYLINFNPLSYPAETVKMDKVWVLISYGKTQPVQPAVLLCDCHEFFNFIKVSFSGYLFSLDRSSGLIVDDQSTWTGSLNRKSRIMNALHAENNYVQLA